MAATHNAKRQVVHYGVGGRWATACGRFKGAENLAQSPNKESVNCSPCKRSLKWKDNWFDQFEPESDASNFVP